MAKRYELTEEQFETIRDILPGKAGDPGRTAEDNHRFINGVMWVLRSGAHWKDMPERYGNWNSTHKRFSRWAKSGVWEAVFKRLLKDPKNDYVMIDSTLVKAHQEAAAGKRGRPSRLWGEAVED
jgi:transposase